MYVWNLTSRRSPLRRCPDALQTPQMAPDWMWLLTISGEKGGKGCLWMSEFSTPSRNLTGKQAWRSASSNTKKRTYEQRVREVEHASFIPLVMSTTGGMAKEATKFYKRLESLLAAKWDQHYSSTLYWLRSRISFSLLRSAIQCIRGARSSSGHPIKLAPVDLVTAKANYLSQ